jgi:hypothetical protein
VGLVWGAGPVFQLPTATDRELGFYKWSAGPTFVVLLLTKKVVTGVLINNLWSFARSCLPLGLPPSSQQVGDAIPRATRIWKRTDRSGPVT